MSWDVLEKSNPELAAFGKERLDGNVAYLATSRPNGAPRVHPVTPIIGAGRVFVFMESTSPKGKDLLRDPRFALHCSVEDNNGGEGEFVVAGVSAAVTDPETRKLAVEYSSYRPADRYILFELLVSGAQRTRYEGGVPVRTEWRAGDGA